MSNFYKYFVITASLLLPTSIVFANPVKAPQASVEKFSKQINIDPKDVQVIFADLQPQLIARSKTVQAVDLSKSVAALAKVAKDLNMPIVFTTVPQEGKPGVLLPDLQAYSQINNTFPRLEVNPFNNQPFVKFLNSNKRKTLVIVGYSSDGAVYQTAVSALKAGYKVYIPVDGIGGQSERIDAAVLRSLEHKGAISTSVFGFSAQLVEDFTQPSGQKVIEAVLPILK